ncbi:MAG: thioredoxin family protein [Oligoflexia bacterium]|nr:thioredoxin family protein [Oligoflexia bacterium]
MALTYSEAAPLGTEAPPFHLPGVDGRSYGLEDFRDARALVVAFICNHCPYVQAVRGRINALAREFAPRGVRLVAINCNDSKRYPDDGFEAMKRVAREEGFVFPYLWDESQEVARAYGAACTPDFFVYGREGEKFFLKYQGRLDDNWKDESAVSSRDLARALEALLAGGEPAREQQPSMGCSIKWK